MKKRFISLLAAAVMLSACGNTAPAETTASVSDTTTTTVAETEITYARIEYEIDPSKPMVALTFDDGPNTTTTVQVLDKLELYNVPASFFLIGNNINDSSAEVVKRAYEMGCEIDNHSKSHPYMNQMSAEEIVEEVMYVSDKVEEITGEPTKFFRPPYIATNADMYANIDMPFICGVGCNDWDSKVTVQERIDNTLNQVKDGTIILLHDAQGNSKTVEALDTIIPTLLDEGYQFVTVAELFEAKGIEINPDDTGLYTIVQGVQ
ncbi:MAG: polysaccharide deacetylase family protein [Oscillospiraceae bacterium]|nr:polysaccharide deacetylase family protein [Oscillospiraceae bacterium]